MSSRAHERESPPLLRRRVSRACDKCHTLKTKCDGKKPVCGRCAGYGYDCSYQGRRHLTPRAAAASLNAMEEIACEYEQLLSNLLPKLDDTDRNQVIDKLNSLKAKRDSIHIQTDLQGTSPATNQTSGNTTNESPVIDSPSSGSASEGFLGVSNSQICDAEGSRKTLGKLTVGQSSGNGREESVRSYNLDDADSTRGLRVLQPYTPSGQAAQLMVHIFFSTVHVAYPFLSREAFEALLPQLWEEHAAQTIPDAWKATIYMVFAWGAAYSSITGETDGSGDKHLNYYHQAKLYLGDVIDIFPPGVDVISCLLLISLYLLMTHKPYRCANMLGMTIRMAQGIGLHTAYKETDLSEHEKERRRRIWYCLFILDRLVALQLGGAPMVRDADFNVELPSIVLDGEPSEVSYLCHMVGLSKVIGFVIDHLYRPAQAVIPLERLLETISALDKELLEWRDGLPDHLRFDHVHSFEQNAVFKRQRNFLGIKFHHLRTLIHRPCLCLETLHYSELDTIASSWSASWDHSASQLAEATCIMEARQTIQMLDGVMDKRDLLWEFPWWQMISCLMCAQSVIMTTRIVYPHHADSSGLEADTETCYKVLQALSAQSASAERCLKMVDQLRATQLRQQELSPLSSIHLRPGPATFLPPFVDGIGSFQDPQAGVVGDRPS